MRYFFLFLIFVVSCSDSSEDNTVFDLSSGLLFVGTAVDYSSSGLFFLDGQSQLTELLAGQSSDFSILPLDDGFLAVNRSVADRNYRLIQKKDTQILIGEQTSLDFLTAGEPSAVLKLEPEVLLFASLSTGSMYILNESTGEATAVEIDKAINDLPFRPVAIQRVEKRIFVIHQGLDEKFQINNTQMIYEIVWRDDKIEFVDFDSNTPGIQGMKLIGSVPTNIKNLDDGRFVLASWCSAYVGTGCKSAYEELLLEKGETKEILDLSIFKILQTNNSFISGNGDLYLGGEGEDKTREFIHVDISEDSQLKTVHTYPSENSYNGLFGAFSNHAGRLWIGDALNVGEGKFDIYENQEWKEEIRLPSVPSLSGFYVP